MDTLSQWIHQHSFLLLVCALLLGSLIIISWFRLWTRRTLVVWGGVFVLAAVILVGLRTPPATVSEVVQEANVANSAESIEQSLDFASTEEVEAYLRQGGKPTLVEFYSDFGIR